MKGLRTSLTATIVILLLVSATGGLVAAQDTDESFVKGFMVNANPNADGTIKAGDTVQIAIFYHNNSTETVIIDYAGVHFDWMPTDSLYGFNTSSYNIQVPSGKDYFFQQQISMKIPVSANGIHSFYAGIDGHTASSAPVSLSSDPVEFMVVGTGATTSPSASPNNSSGISDVAFYGAIIAVVVVVIVLLLVVFMRRKHKPEAKSTQPTTDQTPSSQPQQPSSGQDFSI